MNKEEYTDFISEISEMLGLGKPVDILKLCATTDKFVRHLQKRIADLEQKLEQTEKDLADYQFNYPKIKELEKENAELRNNGFTVSAMTEQQLKVALEKGEQLEKENAELKEKLNFKTRFVKGENAIDQLTKAKEIIKKFSEFVNNEIEYDPEHPQEHTNLWNELCEQAEQFLKEIEK